MTPNSAVKGVLFDVDGTIINTFEHIVQAFEAVLPRFNVVADRAAIQMVIGKTLVDCYREFLHEDYAHEAAELHHQLQQTPEMYQLITVYEGFRELTADLRQAGIGLGVVTNRGRRSIDSIFRYCELAAVFDVVVTCDEVQTPKPDPSGIYLAAQKLGLPSAALAMVGDTAIDVQTAKNASVHTSIAMTHGFGSRAQLVREAPDYVVDSFHEIAHIITPTQERVHGS